MKGNHPLVKWAIKVIESKIEGKALPPVPDDMPKEFFQRKAGAFVTLHEESGALRGCIGTFLPTKENVVEEVAHNAIEAAFRDPRFPPLTREEMESIVVSVDVLSTPERIVRIEELDPKKYGVLVESGWRRGLLLPDLEGVDSVEEQLRIAKLKAGIGEGEKVKVYRFTVERYR